MSMTSRWRAAVADREAGAVAVVVAVVAVLLFGVSALVIDIGQAYARRRAAQTDADLAALAGAAGLPDPVLARQYARDYLQKNLPSGDAPGGDVVPPSTDAVWTDGTLANGEIAITTSNTRIRVTIPARRVDFGFATVLPGGGFESTNVNASATAVIRSPGATLPFFLTTAGASGYSCLKDTSGGGAGAAMRAVLLAPAPKPPTISSASPSSVSTVGGAQVVVNGSNFKNPDVTSVKIGGVEVTVWSVNNPNKLTLTTPPHAAGSVSLSVTNADGTAATTIAYVAPPPAPAPTVTSVTPVSGPQSGGTVVTVKGTGFTGATGVTFGAVAAVSPTVTNATTIQATSPPGTGAVHVHVTNATGTSAESANDLFTYEVDTCGGVNGSYGYLDVPRSKPPAPNGANDLVMINAAIGIDHGWRTWGASTTRALPASGTECKSGNTTIPGAILDVDPGVNGANCVDIQNGNKTNDVATAFLDGYTKSNPDLDPRLTRPDSDHSPAMIHGRPGLDGDHLTKYLTVPIAQFVNNLGTNPTPSAASVAGWLDPAITSCPRFAIVPVLNVAANPANGFYPIKDFAAVFIDSPDTNYGFEPNNNGNQMKAIHAYAFSLTYLPGILGNTSSTIDYIGTGPKVPVLVHDSGDPSY
jgi:Flp pilus assembly protein TadG